MPDRPDHSRYDAFISYSRSADADLAPAIQRGLQRLAKPWHKSRSLRVFRDETGLATSTQLWGSIKEALDRSAWFVLLASPEAAESEWIDKEVRYWIDEKSADRLLIVVTGGEWDWDPDRGDISVSSTALPPALRGAFDEEPRHLDLRWARGDATLTLRNGRFRNAIADLGAPMHGMAKDELEGEDVRQHRRTQRYARVAVGMLSVFLVAAVLAASIAFVQRDRADREARIARAGQLAELARSRSTSQLDVALLLGVEGRRLDDSLRTRSGLLAALNASPHLMTATRLPHRIAAFDMAESGAIAAMVTTNGRLELFRGASGRSVAATALGPPARSAQVAFSANGRQVAAAMNDGRITVFDVPSLTPRAAVEVAPGAFFALNPDGSSLATVVPAEGAVRIWSAVDGDLETTIGNLGFAAGVDTFMYSAPAFSSDGRRLAVGAWGIARVVDLPTRRVVSTVVHSKAIPFHAVTSVRFSDDGSRLAVGDDVGVVEVHDTETAATVARQQTGRGRVIDLRFAPSAEEAALLVTSEFGGPVVVDPGTGEMVAELGSVAGGDGVARFGRSANQVVAVGARVEVQWDLQRVALASVRRAGESVSGDLATSDRRALVAAAAEGGGVQLWESRTGRRLGPPLEAADVGGLAFSPSGRLLAIGEVGAQTLPEAGIQIWDVEARRLVRRIETSATRIPHVAFARGGARLVADDGFGSVGIWDVRNGQKLQSRVVGDLRPDPNTPLAVSPDGRSIATGGGDGVVRVLSLTGGAPRSLAASAGAIQTVAFSPDGRWIASGSSGGELVLAPVQGGSTPRIELSPSGPITDLAFHPDGGSLVANSINGRVVSWELPSLRILSSGLTGRRAGGVAVGFAGRQNQLVSLDDEGFLAFWDTDPDSWVRLACRRAGRNLTPTEWSTDLTGGYHATCPELAVGSARVHPRLTS